MELFDDYLQIASCYPRIPPSRVGVNINFLIEIILFATGTNPIPLNSLLILANPYTIHSLK